MIDLNYISGFFDAPLRENPLFAKYIVKEYIQLMILDYLSTTPYIKTVAFIGDTNLRLVKGIDRFSEDLDFDIKDMTEAEFMEMTDGIVKFLQNSGLNVETKDKQNPKLTAFRRNINFPQLLFDLHLTGHKEERLLLKIEAQDQGITYEPQIVNISGCGFFFPFPVPPDAILLSMKLSALLSRAKGRDFYDTMFLWAQTEPDYSFLKQRVGIETPNQLKKGIIEMLNKTDLSIKKRDFEHLLFNRHNAEKVMRFREFINQKLLGSE